MKVGSVILASGWGATATAPDRSERDVSQSTRGGTRKVVNYA